MPDCPNSRQMSETLLLVSRRKLIHTQLLQSTGRHHFWLVSANGMNRLQGKQKRLLVIWRFSDGRRGHVHQADSLIEGCKSLCDVDLYTIPVPARIELRPWRIRAIVRDARTSLPHPDLLLSTGHSTHLPLLYARFSTRARSVVLMKPSLPLNWFDAVIMPEHDAPPHRLHVIASRGALGACSSGAGRMDRHRGLVMVGGPSKYFKWDPGRIERQIEFIARRMEHIDWVVTDSPRTPSDLRVPEQSNCRFSSFRCQPKGWLDAQLEGCGFIWVSMDSASMLADALNTRAQVNLLELPSRRRHNKLLCHARKLEEEALVQRFSEWVNQPIRSENRRPLNEHFRCARELLKCLFCLDEDCEAG